MIEKYKNQLILNLAVLLFGITGILGKLISLDAITLVWYRLLITVPAIGLFLLYKKKSFRVTPKQFILYICTGWILTIHWIGFYQSIKTSTASIGLICLSAMSLFVAFLEPLFFRRKINRSEVALSVVVIAALLMIFQVESGYSTGIAIGIFSAFFAALFAVANGILVKSNNATTIAFYEMLGGFIGLTFYLPQIKEITPEFFALSGIDTFYLILMGTLCTAFAFIAYISVMKDLSPFTVALTINLEPVYGIMMAFAVFGEEETMSFGFYIGSLVILTTLFANAYLKRRKLKVYKLKP